MKKIISVLTTLLLVFSLGIAAYGSECCDAEEIIVPLIEKSIKEEESITLGQTRVLLNSFGDTDPKIEKIFGSPGEAAHIFKNNKPVISVTTNKDGYELITIYEKSYKNMVISVQDLDGDGSYDRIIYNSKNENGELAISTIDRNWDGLPESVLCFDKSKPSLVLIDNTFLPLERRNDKNGVILGGDWQEIEYADSGWILKNAKDNK